MLHCLISPAYCVGGRSACADAHEVLGAWLRSFWHHASPLAGWDARRGRLPAKALALQIRVKSSDFCTLRLAEALASASPRRFGRIPIAAQRGV